MPSFASPASSDLALDDQPEAASTSSWPSPAPMSVDRYPPSSRDGLRRWSSVEEAKESLRNVIDDADLAQTPSDASSAGVRGEHGDPAYKRWRAAAGLESAVESIDLARELDGDDDMVEPAQGQPPSNSRSTLPDLSSGR